jgi:hypothetical protein
MARTSETQLASDRRRLSRLGKIVPLDARWTLLLTTPEHREQAAGIGSLIQIFLRPMRATDTACPALRPPASAIAETPDGSPLEMVHDPWLQARVDEVSLDSLRELAYKLTDFTTRLSSSREGSAAGELLFDRFRSYGYEDVAYFDYNGWSDNVVARKEGIVRPEEIVVLGGHYDSYSSSYRAPGADDNASGTCGVMETARIFAGREFERTLVFVAFSGEEEGLVGSEAWASWARHQNWQIVAMINLDMIGYLASGDRPDLDLVGRPEDRELLELVSEAVPLYVPELPVAPSPLPIYLSDHASFWAQGYTALFFHEDIYQNSPYIHTDRDIIGLSLNNFDFMTSCVRATVATVGVLAGPAPLRIEHQPLAEYQPADVAYPISARTGPGAAPEDLTLRLGYRTDDGDSALVPLSATSDSGRYEGEIPGQMAGTRVSYFLEALSSGERIARSPVRSEEMHRFLVGFRDLFADDFEEDRGWSLDPSDHDAATGTWIRAAPVETAYQPGEDHTPGAGRLCWVTGNGPPGDDSAADVDEGATRLLSPLLDLSDLRCVEISYWVWYANEGWPDDAFRVEITNDGGISWSPLLELTRSLDGWTHIQHLRVENRVPLTSTVRLRFVAEDEGRPSLVEALLDDVLIRAAPADHPGVPERRIVAIPPGPALRVGPNPADNRIRIRLELPAATPVALSLLDVSGRKIRDVYRGPMERGPHLIDWERRGGAAALPSGVYWLRLDAGGQRRDVRLVLIR